PGSGGGRSRGSRTGDRDAGGWPGLRPDRAAAHTRPRTRRRARMSRPSRRSILRTPASDAAWRLRPWPRRARVDPREQLDAWRLSRQSRRDPPECRVLAHFTLRPCAAHLFENERRAVARVVQFYG